MIEVLMVFKAKMANLVAPVKLVLKVLKVKLASMAWTERSDVLAKKVNEDAMANEVYPALQATMDFQVLEDLLVCEALLATLVPTEKTEFLVKTVNPVLKVLPDLTVCPARTELKVQLAPLVTTVLQVQLVNRV